MSFFINFGAVLVLLIFGGFMCSHYLISILALGYMLTAMNSVIVQKRFWTALPGQRLAGGVFLLAWIFILLAVIHPAAGLVGLIVAFVFGSIGFPAILCGAKSTIVLIPKEAIAYVKNYQQEHSWLQNTMTIIHQFIVKICFMWIKGVKAFLGGIALLAIPSFFLAIGWTLGWVLSFERAMQEMAFCFFSVFLGLLSFGWIYTYLPMAMAAYAHKGDIGVLFEVNKWRKQIFLYKGYYGSVLLATSFLTLLLHLLRIQRIQPKQVLFNSFVFFTFILLAKLLWAKAYALSLDESKVNATITSLFGKILVLGSAFLAAMLIPLGQFISWRGSYGFFDHFIFLLPSSF